MRRTRAWTVGLVSTLVMGAGGYAAWKKGVFGHAPSAPEVAERAVEPTAERVAAPFEPSENAKLTEIDTRQAPRHGDEEDDAAAPARNEKKPSKKAARSSTGARLSGELARDGVCQSAEYWVAAGARSEPPSAREWSEVVSIYQEVKSRLTDWLQSRAHAIGKERVAKLDRIVREMRVVRPPAAEEPDLAYRGAIYFARDEQMNPVLRMGPGFLALARDHADRARFELARAMVQAWNPCDTEIAGLWETFSQCMGMNSVSQCGPTGSGELAWAVSSWVAAEVAPPGCSIAGLKEPQFLVCADRMPKAAPVVEASL